MCQCSTSDCGCSALLVPVGPPGRQGPPGVTPTLTFEVTTLPPGSHATVSQSGGPVAYDVVLGIPTGATGAGTPGADGAPGADGTDGINAFTNLRTTWRVPGIGSIEPMNVDVAAWGADGQWIYLPGAGYFIISFVSGSGQFQVINPGPLQGFPSGVAGNVAGGTIMPIGTPVTPGGIPGDGGSTGPAGASAELLTTNTLPTTAPSPGRASVIYTDSATAPTFTVIYTWNGTSWVQTANIQGAAGTQIVNTPGDPNTTLPAGPIGTYAVRTDVPSMYVKTGSTTWSLVTSLTPTFTQVATQSAGDFGTVPVSTRRVIGYVPRTLSSPGPGAFVFDLAYQSYDLDAAFDIELGWSATSYNQGGSWLWQITNIAGAPIAVTYAAGQFTKKTGLTLPSTLASGATQVYHLVREGPSVLICDTYVSVAV